MDTKAPAAEENGPNPRRRQGVHDDFLHATSCGGVLRGFDQWGDIRQADSPYTRPKSIGGAIVSTLLRIFVLVLIAHSFYRINHASDYTELIGDVVTYNRREGGRICDVPPLRFVNTIDVTMYAQRGSPIERVAVQDVTGSGGFVVLASSLAPRRKIQSALFEDAVPINTFNTDTPQSVGRNAVLSARGYSLRRAIAKKTLMAYSSSVAGLDANSSWMYASAASGPHQVLAYVRFDPIELRRIKRCQLQVVLENDGIAKTLSVDGNVDQRLRELVSTTQTWLRPAKSDSLLVLNSELSSIRLEPYEVQAASQAQNYGRIQAQPADFQSWTLTVNYASNFAAVPETQAFVCLGPDGNDKHPDGSFDLSMLASTTSGMVQSDGQHFNPMTPLSRPRGTVTNTSSYVTSNWMPSTCSQSASAQSCFQSVLISSMWGLEIVSVDRWNTALCENDNLCQSMYISRGPGQSIAAEKSVFANGRWAYPSQFNIIDHAAPGVVQASSDDITLPPLAWACPPDWFNSTDGCHCGCGWPDPDCRESEGPTFGCPPGLVCTSMGVCSVHRFEVPGVLSVSEPCSRIISPLASFRTGYMGLNQAYNVEPDQDNGQRCMPCPGDSLNREQASLDGNSVVCNYSPHGFIHPMRQPSWKFAVDLRLSAGETVMKAAEAAANIVAQAWPEHAAMAQVGDSSTSSGGAISWDDINTDGLCGRLKEVVTGRDSFLSFTATAARLQITVTQGSSFPELGSLCSDSRIQPETVIFDAGSAREMQVPVFSIAPIKATHAGTSNEASREQELRLLGVDVQGNTAASGIGWKGLGQLLTRGVLVSSAGPWSHTVLVGASWAQLDGSFDGTKVQTAFPPGPYDIFIDSERAMVNQVMRINASGPSSPPSVHFYMLQLAQPLRKNQGLRAAVTVGSLGILPSIGLSEMAVEVLSEAIPLSAWTGLTIIINLPEGPGSLEWATVERAERAFSWDPRVLRLFLRLPLQRTYTEGTIVESSLVDRFIPVFRMPTVSMGARKQYRPSERWSSSAEATAAPTKSPPSLQFEALMLTVPYERIEDDSLLCPSVVNRPSSNTSFADGWSARREMRTTRCDSLRSPADVCRAGSVAACSQSQLPQSALRYEVDIPFTQAWLAPANAAPQPWERIFRWSHTFSFVYGRRTSEEVRRFSERAAQSANTDLIFQPDVNLRGVSASKVQARIDCPCLKSTGLVTKEDKAGSYIPYNPSKSPLATEYRYPADFGTRCKKWDLHLPPFCADGITGSLLPAAPGWCQAAWCYVDPATCRGTTPKRSSFFAGSAFETYTLWYSYETCGFSDDDFGSGVEASDIAELPARVPQIAAQLNVSLVESEGLMDELSQLHDWPSGEDLRALLRRLPPVPIEWDTGVYGDDATQSMLTMEPGVVYVLSAVLLVEPVYLENINRARTLVNLNVRVEQARVERTLAKLQHEDEFQLQYAITLYPVRQSIRVISYSNLECFRDIGASLAWLTLAYTIIQIWQLCTSCCGVFQGRVKAQAEKVESFASEQKRRVTHAVAQKLPPLARPRHKSKERVTSEKRKEGAPTDIELGAASKPLPLAGAMLASSAPLPVTHLQAEARSTSPAPKGVVQAHNSSRRSSMTSIRQASLQIPAVAPAPSTAKKSDTKDMMLAAQIVYLDLIRHMLSLQLVPRYELLRIRAAVQDPERDEEMTKRVNDCFQRFIAARSRGEVQIRVVTPPDPMLEELAEELVRLRSRSSHTLSAPESLEIVV